MTAAQAITGQSFSAELPLAVLKTILTNSGASEGILFLMKEGKLTTAASIPEGAEYHREAVDYCIGSGSALIIGGRPSELFSPAELE